MSLEFITPSKGKGRSAGVGIQVDGTQLNFNAETVEVLGLKNKEYLSFGVQRNKDAETYGKLLILKDQETERIPLLGHKSKNGRMYISDPAVAKVAKLVNGEFYPIKKTANGQYYIEHDLDATWSEPVKKVRGAKAASNNDTGTDAAKEIEAKRARIAEKKRQKEG